MIGNIVQNKFKITPFYFNYATNKFEIEYKPIDIENIFTIIGHTNYFDKRIKNDQYKNDFVYLFENKIFACSEEVFSNFEQYFKIIKNEKDVKNF